MQGYLKFKETDEELYEVDVPQKPSGSWIKQVVYFWTCAYLNLVVKIKKWFHIITVKEIYCGLIFILPISKTEKGVKRCIPKVKKLMKKYQISQIVLADVLKQDEAFLQEFQKNRGIDRKVHILNGKELMPYLVKEIVEYISKKRGTNIELENLYLLIKKENSDYEENILFLTQHFKTINIVTPCIKAYQNLAKRLEEKYEVMITVTNNRKKSLKRAKWIINFDLSSEEMKRYTINRTATILYLNKEGIYDENSFEGLHICQAGIDVSQEIKEFFDEQNLLKQCPITILYESTLQKKSFKQVKEQMKKDQVKVEKLYGRRGILTDKEYEKEKI